MATIHKRGEKYRVEIRRAGFYKSASFEFKKDAVEWKTRIERELDIDKYQLTSQNDSMTLKAALEEYLIKVTPKKKGAAREKNRILKWLKHPLAQKKLAHITGKDLAEYRDNATAAGLKDPSIRIELMLLSAIFNTARKEWGYISLRNPVGDITLPKQSKKRERRLEPGELDYLIAATPKAYPNDKHVTELILLAVETGMRQSELLAIDWQDIKFDQQFIHLDETKSGDPRDVPLSPEAIDIARSFERKKGKVFHITQDTLIRGFKRACKRGITLAMQDGFEPKKGFLQNLRFHDLRHEAASRRVGQIQALEVCTMFGWKTPSIALRYYHPNATDIAKKLA